MSDDQQADEAESVDDSDSPLTEQPTLPPQKASDASMDEATLPPRDSSSATDDVTLPPRTVAGDTIEEGATLPEDPDQGGTTKPAVGTRVKYFGDYELLKEIARGGMGVVYKARQTKLNRTVALKMILAGQLASPEDVQRFYIEAEAAASLEHPGIVPIYEVGQHEDQHFFSMGFIEGESLDARVKEGPMLPREAAAITQQISEAIAYAHAQGVIHRDLKPANILIDASGDPKVTDFGLAKKTESDSGLTGTGQILGTPGYMPPEQASGETDTIGPAADIYSLGAILYALLTGRPPFQSANVMDTLVAVLEQEPVAPRQLNPTLDVDLETICLKCLEKDAARRYATADELVAELGRYLNGEPIQARPIGRVDRAWRWCKRKPTLAGMCALAALLLLTLGIGGPMVAIQQAHNAKQQVALRAKADEQAQRADKSARLANERALEAERERRIARRRLYIADIRLIPREWEQSNLGRILELLERHREESDNRGFEWHYWDRRCHSELVTFKRQGPGLVAFTPEGRPLVGQSGEESVGKEYWDVETERRVLSVGTHKYGNFNFGVQAAALTVDCKRVATAGAQSIKVWDTASGRELIRIPLPVRAETLAAMSISPDGRWVGAVIRDRAISVWDVASGQESFKLGGFSRRVSNLAFSPDSQWLAASCNGGSVKLWNTSDGEEALSIKADRHSISSLAFSRDGKRLATTSFSDAAKLWDTATGQQLLALEKAGSIRTLTIVFSADGQRLATGRGATIRVWNASTGKITRTLKGHTDLIRRLVFSPDGKRLMSSSYDGTVKLWDVVNRSKVPPLQGPHNAQFADMAFSPDGKLLATANNNGTVTVWNFKKRQIAIVLKEHPSRVTGLAFGPQGARLVSVGLNDKTLKLWDIKSGKNLLTLSGHTKQLHCVAFSPDGHRLASGAGSFTSGLGITGELKLWDVATGRVVRNIKTHTSALTSIAYSPDGRWLATASDDNTVKLRSAETGEETLTLKGHSGIVTSVSFSPDGKRIVSGSGDKTVKVWDAETGQETLTLKGHTGRVASVAFSPDGRRLATVSSDGTARVWDLAFGEELLSIVVDSTPDVVAFSPNGEWLVTGSDDLIHLWGGRRSGEGDQKIRDK